jgi:hypothetical protein
MTALAIISTSGRPKSGPSHLRRLEPCILDEYTKGDVQTVNGANMSYLAIPGFVSAEPGIPIIDGAVHREQAVIVFVTRKR